VRMIKPNLIFSHDWHVQPNCQRSLRVIRLSGTLLDRGLAFRLGCPRTCCAHRNAYFSTLRRFCANLLNISNLGFLVKSISVLRSRPRKLVVGGCSSLRFRLTRPGNSPVQKLRTAQNINQHPAQYAPEPLRLTEVSQPTGDAPGSCNGLFSVGFPTVAQGLLPHLILRTSITTCFPLPSTGQAYLATGRRLLLICNFQRVAQATPLCKRLVHQAVVRSCNFPRVSILRPDCKLPALWETPSLWETPANQHHYCVFVRLITENCELRTVN
jgi:hypothetical protein